MRVVGGKLLNEIVVGQVCQHLVRVHQQQPVASFTAEVNHHLGQVAAAGTYIQHNLSAFVQQREVGDDALEYEFLFPFPIRVGKADFFIPAQGIILSHLPEIIKGYLGKPLILVVRSAHKSPKRNRAISPAGRRRLFFVLILLS